jgi:hypothetical protein
MARIGEAINVIPKNRSTAKEMLLDLAIAIFLDNLGLKFYFDSEAYTPTYIYIYCELMFN